MIEIINAIKNMMDFICSYKLNGCAKTMLFGSVLIILLLLFSRGKKRSVFCRCYCLLLVFAALLVEQSRLYYTGEMFRLSNWLNKVITPFLGKCYFAVMCGLLAVIFLKQMWFCLFVRRHWSPVSLKELIPLIDEEEQGGRTSRFWCRYQKRIRIYQQPEVTTAFSGGILHPYIILPAMEEGREREQAVMLKHELTHIRHGHIVLLNLVVLLRCYWWINPLVYVWEYCLRRELECVCDGLCLVEYGIKQGEYAEVMLFVASKCVVRKKYRYKIAGSYFIKGKRPFYEMRYRIISMTRQFEWRLNTRRIYMAIAGVFIFVLLACSYPRYSYMKEIALYDSHLKPVFFDDVAVHKAVQISGSTIVIEPESFRELLKDYQVTDEYVYLCYNNIVKVPGAGGGGDVTRVSTSDFTDIIYLAGDTFTVRVERFILKWL